jgi:hypothetical protein
MILRWSKAILPPFLPGAGVPQPGPNCNINELDVRRVVLVSWPHDPASWAVRCIQVPTLETSAPAAL